MKLFIFIKFSTVFTLVSGSNSEPTCSPLNSISRAATCSRFGDRVHCNTGVLPFTRAKVTCRINYGLEGSFVTGVEQDVECNRYGKWEPEPITCSPVCGFMNNPGKERRAMSSDQTETGAFPWHVNLWREIITPRGLDLEFRCGATIIQTNLVVTAAHCVIDEKTRSTVDPKRLLVTAGKTSSNIERSFSRMVRHKVKNAYRYCERFGLLHGYASDVVILELQNPFEFSTAILPACLDVSSNTERTFHPGITGGLAGYGGRYVDTLNPVLQTIGVTYMPDSECGLSVISDHRDQSLVREDQFCGFSNGANVCDLDHGSGFVVKKNGLWYLMGIFIKDSFGSSLKNGQKICGKNFYSLHTKVPSYMPWIQEVIFQLERYKSYPMCSPYL